jgi:hypothetical protein
MSGKKQQTEQEVVTHLSDFRMTRVRVPILGVTELIMNRWTARAIKSVEDKQQGRVPERKPRVPKDEYKASIYKDSGGSIIIPEVNIKACLTDAGRTFPQIAMAGLRQMIRVNAPASVFGEHRMRTDPVRLQGRSWSVAYRAGFPEWSTVFDFAFVGTILSQEIVLNIVAAAGMVGICAWRPGASNSGWAGTFIVDKDKINEQSIQAY